MRRSRRSNSPDFIRIHSAFQSLGAPLNLLLVEWDRFSHDVCIHLSSHQLIAHTFARNANVWGTRRCSRTAQENYALTTPPLLSRGTRRWILENESLGHPPRTFLCP